MSDKDSRAVESFDNLSSSSDNFIKSLNAMYDIQNKTSAMLAQQTQRINEQVSALSKASISTKSFSESYAKIVAPIDRSKVLFESINGSLNGLSSLFDKGSKSGQGFATTISASFNIVDKASERASARLKSYNKLVDAIWEGGEEAEKAKELIAEPMTAQFEILTQNLDMAKSGTSSMGSTLSSIAPIAGLAVGAFSALAEGIYRYATAERDAKDSLGLVDSLADSLDNLGVKYKNLSNSDMEFLSDINSGIEQRQARINSALAQGEANISVANMTNGVYGENKYNKLNPYAQVVTDMANGGMPGLNLQLDATSSSKARTDFFAKYHGNAFTAQAMGENLYEAYDARIVAEKEVVKKQKERDDALEASEKAATKLVFNKNATVFDRINFRSSKKKEKKAENSLVAAQGTVTGLNEEIEDLTGNIEAKAMEKLSVSSAEEAFNMGLYMIEEDFANLMESYQGAKDSALQSIQGRFGMMEGAETFDFSENSKGAGDLLDNYITAQNEQTAFKEQYAGNLSAIYDFEGKSQDGDGFRLSAELLSRITDENGGAEFAAALAEYVEMANKGDKDALAKIEALNSSYLANAESEQLYSDIKGQIDVDLNGSIRGLGESISEFMVSLDATKDIKDVAIKYGESFVSELTKKENQVAEAGQTLVDVLIAQFQSKYKVEPETNAIGTTNASNIFLAGEEGPELVIGAGGSRVFTAGATSDILSRAYNDAVTSVESSNRIYAASFNNDSISRQEIHTNKTITLKIEGGNSITVDINGFKDQFVDMLSENLRPVLVNIIEEDIFEEGEGSYIF